MDGIIFYFSRAFFSEGSHGMEGLRTAGVLMDILLYRIRHMTIAIFLLSET